MHNPRENRTNLVPSGSKYTDVQRKEAAALYLHLGVFSKVAEVVQVPERTIRDWAVTDWWEQVCSDLRGEITAQSRAKWAQIIDIAQDSAIKSLKSGDVRGKDAVVMAAVAQDKARILDNLPTKLTASVDMTGLLDQFTRIAGSTSERRVIVDPE